ncbi:hypothetical protein [Mycobacterium xenopi]|uniref:hypothetical protein n=1 Tax=Mycobacterium xenopi TaxID=1789 RepID=UPI000D8ADD7D|nr:hypothetical protein [Mycobacterium xenopi]SPX88467.1 Uncharacterised protein [Mycobacterium xenopi]
MQLFGEKGFHEMEHVISTGGRTYRVSAGDDDTADVDAIVAWLCETYGQPASVVALSRQQVLARIGRSAIPAGFPQPDVVIGDAGRDSGGYTRGWLAATVAAWEDAHATSDADAAGGGEGERGGDAASVEPAAGGSSWVPGARQWSGVSAAADTRVAILTSRGALTPSGVVLTRGPLPTGADLARFVWHRWPSKPAQTPQVWITAPALAAAGMTPPKKAPTSSEDLAAAVGKVFDCQVTSAKAGWFTAVFSRDEASGGDSRRVHLVLLPFLWLDPAGQRPKDLGVAGTRGTATELPADEDAAAAALGERIAWVAEFGEGVLPAARPASVGAALLDAVRRRGRSAHRIEACPLPDTVYAETPRVDPDIENWKHMPHDARGDRVDVEVDQRAAYLASAGQVELGYGGVPIELSKADPAVFAEKNPPYGLWRVTTPPAASLDGLSRRLPLPHGNMQWDAPATYWTTTRAVQHLVAPIEDGGAGLSAGELRIDGGWVWPQHGRLLRTWADILRAKLAEATAAGRQDQIDLIKAVYKAFLGRMAGGQHPPGQRHYQQPVWAATIRADTRWRALRYATHIATTLDLYPIAARDIDTFVYRIPADLDPAVLAEDSEANGKYRIKRIVGEG